MRKNFKKYLALACAAAMLIPAAAPATAYAADDEVATSGKTEATGDSAIENDNSEAPVISNVILPTLTNDTYDFTIDIDGLLNQFSSDYVASKTVYFPDTKVAAKLALPSTDTTNALYVETIEAQSDLTALNTLASSITAGTQISANANMTDTNLAAYYVWQPALKDNGEPNGNGEFTQLTNDNIDTFFEVLTDDTITAKADCKSGTFATIFDGKLYKKTYTVETDAAKLLKFVGSVDVSGTAKPEVVSYDNKALFVGAASSPTSYTPATLDAANAGAGANVEYTLAEMHYTDTSDEATITNKSTFDIAMTVDVELSANNGLAWYDSAFTSATAGPNLYMAITDSTNAAKVADNKASASFIIGGTGVTNTSTILYRSTETKEQATGSNQYYRYVMPNLTYKTASFYITAAADKTTTGYEDAWKAYIEKLNNRDYTKPTIDVVYSWEVVELDPEDTDNKTYISDAGSEYGVATAGDTWCTSATVSASSDTATPGFENSAYTYMAGTALNMKVFPSTGTVTAVRHITDMGTTYAYTSSDYSYANGVLTIPAAAGKLCTISTNRGNSGGVDCVITLYVTIDGTEYSTTVTVQPKSN